MPIQLHGLRPPSVSIPTPGELRAKFTAFTGKVTSSIRNAGQRALNAVRSLSSRQVSTPPQPPPSPIQALRADGASLDPRQAVRAEITSFDRSKLKQVTSKVADEPKRQADEVASNRGEHAAKFASLKEELITKVHARHQGEHAEKFAAVKGQLENGDWVLKKQAVPQREISRSDKLAFQMSNPGDNLALGPRALKPAQVKVDLLPEPTLEDIKPLLTSSWGSQQKAFVKELGSKFSQLQKFEKRGQTDDAQRIGREIKQLGRQLGSFIGKTCVPRSQDFQQSLALGAGGQLKSELWQMLRGMDKSLPAWSYGGLESETQSETGPQQVDRSGAKAFLDTAYNAMLGELDPRATSGGLVPTEITFKGERYLPTKELGKGGFAIATLFTNTRGESVVVKSPRNPDIEACLTSEVENARNEFKVHLALAGPNTRPHPNILQIHGVLRTDQGLPMAVLDLAPGGSVNDLMTERLPVLMEKGLVSPHAAHLMRLTLLRESIEGMIEMQERFGARHGDFKPDNLLIGSDGHVKVADFGLTTFGQDKTVEGTSPYKAPEYFLPGNTLTPKVDTWAIGVFAAELLHGKRPFVGREDGEIEPQLKTYANQGDLTAARNYISKLAENPDARDPVQGVTTADRFLNSMLHPDPEKRPSLSEALKSSLFEDLVGRDVGSDLSPKVRELIQAITANPADDALVKAKSDALGG